MSESGNGVRLIGYNFTGLQSFATPQGTLDFGTVSSPVLEFPDLVNKTQSIQVI